MPTNSKTRLDLYRTGLRVYAAGLDTIEMSLYFQAARAVAWHQLHDAQALAGLYDLYFSALATMKDRDWLNSELNLNGRFLNQTPTALLDDAQ